jgi:hypothetical protein
MVDQILSRVIFLCHGSIDGVLVAEVSVKIDLRRHDGPAGKTHTRGSGGNRHLAAAAYAGKDRAFDNERRVFDGRSTIAGDQPRTFEYRSADGRRLALGDSERQS